MPELNELIGPYLREDADVETILKNVTGYVETKNNEFTANLTKNRDQILEEKRKYKTQADELAEKYSWLESLEKPVTQESYSDLVSQLDTLKSSVTQNADEFSQKLNEKYEAGKEVALQSIKPKLTAYETELKEAKEARDKYKSQFENFQVENKLRETISKLGVQADDFWFAGLKNSAQAQFGEKGLEDINVPFNGNLLPLEDWGRAFVNSDTGKKMIPAGFNSGVEGYGSESGREGGIPSAEDIAKIPDQAKRLAMYEKYGYA